MDSISSKRRPSKLLINSPRQGNSPTNASPRQKISQLSDKVNIVKNNNSSNISSNSIGDSRKEFFSTKQANTNLTHARNNNDSIITEPKDSNINSLLEDKETELLTEHKKDISILGIIEKILKTIRNLVVVPAIIVLFIHFFIFQAFYVKGSSMEPTLTNNDYLIISKIELNIAKIQKLLGNEQAIGVNRGDIVVFRNPSDPDTFFIKRVIGIPGDTVVVDDGSIFISNSLNPSKTKLTEEYINPQFKTEHTVNETIDNNYIFVVGDNRSPNGSYDSRSWGQLPVENIIGISRIKILPTEDFSITHSSSFNELE